MSLYVDTSIWYAAADRSDRSNRRAQQVLSAGEPLVCSDHVLLETWTLLHHRLHRIAADRFWQGLRAGVACIEPVGRGDLEAAWEIGQDFPDQDYSLADRTSFAVMLRLGLDRAASLDADFATFRFGPGRRHAFTVLG